MSFWEWVATHALDGIAGGVIGGAVAWWLLRQTIQNERRVRESAARDARRDEARKAMATLYATLNSHIPSETWPQDRIADFVGRLVADMTLAHAALAAVSDELADKLKAVHDKLADAIVKGGHEYDLWAIARFREEVAPEPLWALFEELSPGTKKDITTTVRGGSGDLEG